MRIKKVLGTERMALLALFILAVSAEITSAGTVATNTQNGTVQPITSTHAVSTQLQVSSESTSTTTQTVAANTQTDTVQHITSTQANATQLQVCSGNEESCFNDTGYLVCVPQGFCDILYVLVTFKIDGVSFDLVNVAFAFWKDTFKTAFAKFLQVDKASIMDDFSIFRGSLGVNIPVKYNPDLPHKLDGVRQEIESGTKTIDLQGLLQNVFPVVPGSFGITVTRAPAEITSTSTRTVAANTQTDTVQHNTSTQAVTTQLPVCSGNETHCFNDAGYLVCVPWDLCDDIEYVIVTYKIAGVVYDLVKYAFAYFKDAFKTAFANFLQVDKKSIMDHLSIFRGSLGVNIPVKYGPDLPYKLNGVRQQIKSGTKTNLDGFLEKAFPIESDSFRIIVIRETGGGDCYNISSRQYMGTTNRTKSGLTCQRWDDQTPHSHTKTEPTLFPDDSVTAAENYCRDPDGENTPWCYTLNEATRWEACNITRCKACSGNVESCLNDNGTEVCVLQNHCDILYVKVTFKIQDVSYDLFKYIYQFSKGTYKTTFAEFLDVDPDFIQDVTIFKASSNILGVTLTIDHSKDLPHKIDVARRAIDSGTHIVLQGVKRNVLRDSFHIIVTREVEMITSDNLWTQTTDSLMDVTGTTATSEPEGDDCFETTSAEYNGTVNRTKSGLTCQRWDVQTPHNHSNTEPTLFPDESAAAAENYCRDPDGEDTPWCYTLDNTTRWEKCDITRCRGNTSCHGNDINCMDDFGYLVCVPQKVCDILSVIGSVKVGVELKSSSELLEALDNMRQSIDTGKTQVELIGKEYTVMPNTVQVTVNRAGTTATSLYSDKPVSTPMMSTYMPEYMTTLERENKETVAVPVSTYMPYENITSDKENKETGVVPVSTYMPEVITTSYKEDKETVAVPVSTYMPDENTTSYKEDKETVPVPTYRPDENTTSDKEDKETVAVTVSTYMPDENTTSYKEDKETVPVPTYRPDENTTSDKEDKETVVVPVSTYKPEAITTSYKEDRETVAVPTYMPDENTTSDKYDKETVAVPVSTDIPDEMTTLDKEDKETVAVTVSTNTPEEMTTSDAEVNETVAVTVSSNMPEDMTTSDAEEKETVAVPVSTNIPEDMTTSNAEDKETVAVPVSTHMPEDMTTLDAEDKETVAVPVSTNMPEDMTTSDVEDKETVAVPVSTNMPEDMTTLDAEDKETVAVPVSTNMPEDMTTSDAEDKETVAVPVSTNMPEDMTTLDAEDKETVAVPVSTNMPEDMTTSDAEDKETIAVPVSTNMPEDTTTSDAEDKETVDVTVSTSIPKKITTSDAEDKETVAVPVSTNMPEEMTTSDIEDKDTVTTARDKDGPTNSTVPSTKSIVSTAEPDTFSVTTENYRIQTDGISGANPLEGPLTAVLFTAMIIRAL